MPKWHVYVQRPFQPYPIPLILTFIEVCVLEGGLLPEGVVKQVWDKEPCIPFTTTKVSRCPGDQRTSG